MKISVNDEELFTLSEIQKKVLKNEIFEDIFEDDMKRRLHWVIMHIYEQCFRRLKAEWEPKLKSLGYTSIPLDNDEFAALVFSLPEYRNRTQRDIQY